MYKSPIEVIYDKAVHKILKDAEERMMCAVQQAVGYKVDKDELIKALRYDRSQYEQGIRDGIAQKAKWIPTSERMPKDGQNVLFCDIEDDIMLGYHIKGRPDTHFSQDGTFDDIKNVKAWMPLPEAHEEKEETE